MSSRTSETSPVDGSKAPAAWIDPVERKSSWRTRTSVAARLNAGSDTGTGGPGTGIRRSSKASIDAVPHTPHDDVVPWSRGDGAGARPPVETETTLYAVSDAGPVAQ